jgi:hypothetical protein
MGAGFDVVDLQRRNSVLTKNNSVHLIGTTMKTSTVKTSTIKTLPLAILMGVGAAAAATVLHSPLANADEATLPEAGSESARDTLDDIAAAGYTASINWVQGVNTVPLSQCSVTSINSADATGSNPTVYVTIDCPK